MIDDTVSIVRDIPSLEILGLDEKQRKDLKRKTLT